MGRIRPARPEDVAGLPDIERAAASLFVRAGIGGVVSVMPIEDLEAARLRGGLLVAVDAADRPVGFAVMDAADGEGHLCELDVHPDHARQGLGAALLHAGIAWAKARGLACVTLTTYRDLPWNGPFYAKHGFDIVPESEWSPQVRAHAEEEGVVAGSGRVVMRRSLTARGVPPAGR